VPKRVTTVERLLTAVTPDTAITVPKTADTLIDTAGRTLTLTTPVTSALTLKPAAIVLTNTP
jgi:hypothetical protein